MARPKKNVEQTKEQKKELVEKLVQKTAEENVVAMAKKEVFVPEEFRVEHKSVSSEPFFSKEHSEFLSDFLNFTKALYHESNSVSVRVKLQTFERIMQEALAKNANC